MAQEGRWTAAFGSSLHLRVFWSKSRAFSAARHQKGKNGDKYIPRREVNPTSGSSDL